MRPYVAVLDADYATSAELVVGDTIDIAGTSFEIVGQKFLATAGGHGSKSLALADPPAALTLSRRIFWFTSDTFCLFSAFRFVCSR